MRKDKTDGTAALDVVLTEFEICLEGSHDHQVTDFLDHQILLAAEQQLKDPQHKRSYHLSWFRRLSLPLYAVTSLAFAFYALDHLWQPPIYHSATEQAEKTRVIISQPQQLKSVNAISQSKNERKLRALILPTAGDLASPKIPISAGLSKKSQPLILQPEAQQQIFSGSDMTVKNYSEKQAWVAKIVGFMKSGQLELARNEMVAFKKIYPDYPIEEQIKRFLP